VFIFSAFSLQVKAVLDEDQHASSKIRVELRLCERPLDIRCNQAQANAIMGILQAILLCFQKPPTEAQEIALEAPPPSASLGVGASSSENKSGFDVSYNCVLGKWSFVVEPNGISLQACTFVVAVVDVRLVEVEGFCFFVLFFCDGCCCFVTIVCVNGFVVVVCLFFDE
jgi:hypothetical protein